MSNFNNFNSFNSFKETKDNLNTLIQDFEALCFWEPNVYLKSLCHESLINIENIEKRLNDKLIITLLGPCGAGKSTLINALSGIDNLSKASNQRPTTQNLVILCQNDKDSLQITDNIGFSKFEICQSLQCEFLKNIILIDTPDIDSNLQKEHIPIVEKIIKLSDILICVFDLENPKRRDFIDFLSLYISQFDKDSLFCVLNKCDRQDEKELKNIIIPDFAEHIQKAWDRKASKILCISARKNLKNPNWDEKAPPRNNFDQFKDLKNLILNTFNNSQYSIDRRLENLKTIKNNLFQDILKEIEKDEENLIPAKNLIEQTQKTAISEAINNLKSSNLKHFANTDIDILLYQKLSQKWFGPIGLLISIWIKLFMLIISFFKIIGLLDNWRNKNNSNLANISDIANIANISNITKSNRNSFSFENNTEILTQIILNYRLILAKNFINICDSFAKARFKIDKTLNFQEDLSSQNLGLSNLWANIFEDTIEREAKKFSNIFLQFICNVPTLAVLAYICWIILKNFLFQNYLSLNFFVHAILASIIVLFASFFIFQSFVKISLNSNKIFSKILNNLNSQSDLFYKQLNLSSSSNVLKNQVDLIFEIKKKIILIA